MVRTPRANTPGIAPMTDLLDSRWDRCKASIEKQISAEDAATWLAALQLREVRPQQIVLGGIPNSFCKNRIVARFQPLIVENLRACFPDIPFDSDPVLELRVATEAQASPTAGPGHPTSPSPDVNPADAETRHGVHHTLETLLPYPGNESALHFARQVADKPGQRFNPLLVVGATGLGKSHLLQALGNELSRRHPPWSIAYRSGEAFKNEVLDAITRRRMQPLRDFYRSLDALLVDDLEFLLVSQKAQEELLHTFDSLHRRRRQLVFSVDRYPRAMGGLHPPLRSRLEAGLMVELAPPDAPSRYRFALVRARAEGIQLLPEVAQLLAERITHDLRQLEGAVVRLGAYAALYNQPITLEFAECHAAPLFDPDPQRAGIPAAREAVLERVADRFGLTVRVLKGRSRSPNIAGARRIAVHLLKTVGSCSYAEIGATLGNRAHSTMVHAHHTLLAEMNQDDHLKRAVMRMAEKLAYRGRGDA